MIVPVNKMAGIAHDECKQNEPQQEEHCPNCPNCGKGGCSIRHQRIGSRVGSKAIKHSYYHCKNYRTTQPLMNEPQLPVEYISTKTTPTGEPQLSAEMEKRFREEFGDLYEAGGGGGNGAYLPQSALCTSKVEAFIASLLDEQKKQLTTAIEAAKREERERWYSPFDGLEIKLMYRDGEKVVQNRQIFSLEQIEFIRGFYEVVQLKFSYMLKDLLAEALNPQTTEENT